MAWRGSRATVAGLTAAAFVAAALAAPAAAATTPLGLTSCAEPSGEGIAPGLWQCDGLVQTWDGIPLDATVVLPRRGASNLPLVAEIHGFGNSKWEYMNPAETAYTDNVYSWARRGYAVLTYTARGLWGSCGTPEARAANPTDCARGWIHLADVRYEARDTQELIGRLVDQGIADPARLGVTGDSYGGGQSLMLASLSDRVMLPDGSLVAWRSPAGVPLRLAAAAPVIPWADLVNAAAPNGRALTQIVSPRSLVTDPVGVEKASFVNAIFLAAQFATGPGQPLGEPFVPGRPVGFLANSALDPESDVPGWVSRTDRGEPYDDAEAARVVGLLGDYHSAINLDDAHAPPPLFLASGFTDDLFPADEVIRYANRVSEDHPKVPIRMLLGDFGHQRASNDSRDRAALLRILHRWFDHFLRGRGAAPPRSAVTAFVQRCPRERASGGPLRARRYERLARGEVRLRAHGAQTISPGGGDPQVAAAIDPVAGMGDGCVEVAAGPEAGTATYDLAPVGRTYSLVGAPTLIARIAPGSGLDGSGEIAMRLWDVAPDGTTQRLVARGLWRPNAARNVVQLHPAAWAFRRGHTPRLELLSADDPYARPANGAYSFTIERLRMRLPIRRRPDCSVVMTPRRPVRSPQARNAPLAAGVRSRAQRDALSARC